MYPPNQPPQEGAGKDWQPTPPPPSQSGSYPPSWSQQPTPPPPPTNSYPPTTPGQGWQGQAPYAPVPGQMPNYMPPPPRKKSRKKLWITIVVIFVLLVIIGAINSGGKTAPQATTGTTPTQAAQTTQQSTHAPATPTATSKPKPTFATFGDGTWQIGKDIKPGTYRTRVGTPGCYYARLSGFGGSIGEILSNDNTDDPAIVTIGSNDKGFESRGCGTWTKDLSRITGSKTSFNGGIFFINTDITPGTYKSSGQTGCYYARLAGFSGGISDIISNDNTDTAAIVTIAGSDKGFNSKGCGTWTRM